MSNHPILATVVGCVLLFGVLWCVFYLNLKGSYYFMDPQDNLTGPEDPRAWRLKGRTFTPLMERYFDVAKTIIGLGTGSIAVMAGFLGYVAKTGADISRVQEVVRVPIFFLAFSILNLVVLLMNLSLDYEEYLVAPQSYTAGKYSLNLALGVGGLLCFIIGYFWLATRVVG